MVVGTRTAALAYVVAAIVMLLLLVTASALVSFASGESLRAIRMSGSAVKRWSGWVLVVVGLWFVALAAASSPALL